MTQGLRVASGHICKPKAGMGIPRTLEELGGSTTYSLHLRSRFGTPGGLVLTSTIYAVPLDADRSTPCISLLGEAMVKDLTLLLFADCQGQGSVRQTRTIILGGL